jgi:photosystem II stability/assembly factor-like uncharacterized protein
MRLHGFQAFALAGALTGAAVAAGQVAIDSNSFGGIRARSIGPAVMSGRIASIDAVPADPASDRRLTVWVGSASGGVWKSVDAGISFKAVFDEHPQSIGAVRVDPSDPDVVWAGTGESWTRNSVSVGRGVHKTTDGGDTWKLMGLEDSERIGAIRVDPGDGDTVWVCATGHLWDAGEERGVFRTRDGGETWEKVLYVDADTGCADLDLDPQDPRIVYAGMWQFRRRADFFTSGGPGSGLYKSSDGGDTWQRLTNGLPDGELGRITVAVSPSRPSVVYAIVEAEKTALYRSDDVGASWTEVSTSLNVQVRPFYFGELVVDPADFRRVYKPGFLLTVSTDGGKSFTSPFSGFGSSIHPDHHALWIDPTNPQTVILGTDGGVYVSHDRAARWRAVEDLPVSQFYHVAHDMEWPYNVYGGLQDNGTWTGPSRAPGGILSGHWKNIGFGDGFWAFPDPTTPGHVYVEYQGGQLMRVAQATGEVKSIHPYAGEGEEKLRFNWNTPIHLSPNDPKVLYYGSQYLHRSADRGESWQTISPDLTTDDPEKQRQQESGGLTTDNTTAENHCTIFTISESPQDPAVIWAGTDDGNLQVTRDGGATWSEVSANAAGVPDGTWVSRVEASPHDAATAFVTFDGHHSGDMATYVHKTTDYGATFTSLATDDLDGYAHVVKQDPVHPGLLYLGTEHGLFLSVDGGGQWARFEENLPPVSVRDLVVHPTEHDLILATHGRGIYVIDDLTPLRHLTQEILDSDVALLPSRPAAMVISSQLQWFPADHEFVGSNPPEAAWITYYLKKRHLFGDLKVEVYDDDGELIASLPGGKRRGLNRVEWPMRLKPPKYPAATSLVPGFLGPRVKEGTYRVRLIKGKQTLEGEVALVADPRSPHSAADRFLQQDKALELYHLLSDLTYLAESLEALRDGAKERAGRGELRPADAARLTALADGCEELRATLVSTHPSGMLSGQERLRERLGNLYGKVSSYDGRPTDSQLAELDKLAADLQAAEKRVEGFVAAELPAVDRVLEKRGVEPLSRLSREDWEARESGGGGATSARDAARRMAWAAF